MHPGQRGSIKRPKNLRGAKAMKVLFRVSKALKNGLKVKDRSLCIEIKLRVTLYPTATKNNP